MGGSRVEGGGVRENQGGDQVWGDWQEEKTGRENGNAFSY